MKLNFYKEYLEKLLKTEIEELDINKVKEYLTKRTPDSSAIKGAKFLAQKDIFHSLTPSIVLVGILCFFTLAAILVIIPVIIPDSHVLILNYNIKSNINELLLCILFPALYVFYFGSQRNKIIKTMLEEKLLQLEIDKKDIFGYKKINKLLTQNM